MSVEVSIITTCVDMLELTKRCVELIKQHTPTTYEQILVCDKPGEEMMEWLSRVNNNIIFATNPQPIGAPSARNLGMNIAKGEYISFVDNDISVTDGWFEPLMNALKVHPEYGWVASRVIRGSIVMNWAVASCCLFSREAIDRVGLFDERFSQGIGWEDNDYLLRFWKAGYYPHGVHKSTVYHPPEPTTLKAVHGDTMPEKYELNRKLFIEKWGVEVMQIDWVNIPYEE